MNPLLRPRWLLRDVPLEARAVAAMDEPTVHRLASRILHREHLRALTGTGARDFMLLLGAPEHLPWVPGLRYLGPDPLAPDLLLPTTLELDLPAPLVLAALRREQSLPAGRFALLPEGTTDSGEEMLAHCVSIEHATPLQESQLAAWLSS